MARGDAIKTGFGLVMRRLHIVGERTVEIKLADVDGLQHCVEQRLF
jgi:hypothetical protein